MEARRTEAASSQRLSAGALAGLAAAFALLALGVYRSALGGDFVSDDYGNVVWNPWIQSVSLSNVLALLDPFGDAALYTANYAPVHLLGHMAEWAAFGDDTTGYHVVNVVLHGVTSALLAALLAARGLPRTLSIGVAALFLLHPANVEAVAWIFQLKTILSLGFTITALLLFARHPALATLAFVLALLSKAQALLALPVAAAFVWVGPAEGRPARPAPWLALWAALGLLYAWPQFFSFERVGQVAAPDAEPFTGLRTMGAIGARYLVISATSWGVSAFHEPARARSWLDPWFLAGLALGVLLAARVVLALVRRREEAAWWIWAAAAYAPVSQIFSFLYPMADRYLYPVLPGLLGAAAFALDAAWRERSPALPAGARRFVPAAAAAAALLVAAGFGLHSAVRAGIWRTNLTLVGDAAKNYPQGTPAHQLRARDAAGRGDVEGAVRELRGALALGWDYFPDLQTDPALAKLRGAPSFQALERDVVHAWLGKNLSTPVNTQASLRMRGFAYAVLGDLPAAVAAYEEALALGGPRREEILREVAPLRARLRVQQRREAGGADGGGS